MSVINLTVFWSDYWDLKTKTTQKQTPSGLDRKTRAFYDSLKNNQIGTGREEHESSKCHQIGIDNAA